MSFQKSNTQVGESKVRPHAVIHDEALMCDRSPSAAKETLQPDSTKSDSAVAGQTLTGKISESVYLRSHGPSVV